MNSIKVCPFNYHNKVTELEEIDTTICDWYANSFKTINGQANEPIKQRLDLTQNPILRNMEEGTMPATSYSHNKPITVKMNWIINIHH